MAKKRTKKTEFNVRTVELYIKKHSAVVARIVVALIIVNFVIGMQFIYKDSRSKQSITPSTQNMASCLIENHDCTVMKKSNAKSKRDTKTNRKTQDQNAANCLPYQTVINLYNTVTTNALNQTNQQADSVRANAQNSGQSYQDFDNSLNNIFSSYNSNVISIYNSYSLKLGDCKSQLNPPALFNMFNP
jgi:LAS superfamily LD-carboxypeptidase LdcB